MAPPLSFLMLPVGGIKFWFWFWFTYWFIEVGLFFDGYNDGCYCFGNCEELFDPLNEELFKPLEELALLNGGNVEFNEFKLVMIWDWYNCYLSWFMDRM